MTKNSRRQGIFWLLTIKKNGYDGTTELPPESLPEGLSWIRGQLECGSNTAYEHWQVFVAFRTKQSVPGVKRYFGSAAHAELSRSQAAADYVWKDDTAIPGTR